METITLVVEVSTRDLPFLQVLGDPTEVLEDLAAHAADGGRRPGSWERGWIEQVPIFGWHEKLEPDPEVHYYVRPKTHLGRGKEGHESDAG